MITVITAFINELDEAVIRINQLLNKNYVLFSTCILENKIVFTLSNVPVVVPAAVPVRVPVINGNSSKQAPGRQDT